MLLTDELVRQGRVLFRWRSALPMAFVPIGLAGMWAAGDSDRWLGEAGEEAWVYFCFLIAIAGQTIRPFIAGYVPELTSGRNTRVQRAESLNTLGFYSVCRHPLYVANFIVFLGVLLAMQSWLLVGFGVLIFWLYYERIMAAEEAFLNDKFGRAFKEWAAVTPAVIPAWHLWRGPERSFSWRMVLRREYYGYFAIIAVFFAIEVVSDLVVDGDPPEQWLRTDFFWLALFVAGAVAFVALRTIKKATSLLDDDTVRPVSEM